MSNNDIFLSIVTGSLAIIGTLITILQFRLARKKRKDDLFKLRYEFYKKISRGWLETSNKDNPPWDVIDLIPASQEAYFLFGEDIRKHILSLDNERASHDQFPEDDFNAPFDKYLKLD